MFRFHKPLDIITLYHKVGSPASVRASQILSRLSAVAAEASNASDGSGPGASHSSETLKRPAFQLDITEELPSGDQLQTIMEYTNKANIGHIIKGATNVNEAFKKYRENPENFQRPVIVDWNRGHVLASDNESEILKMLNMTAKED